MNYIYTLEDCRFRDRMKKLAYEGDDIFGMDNKNVLPLRVEQESKNWDGQLYHYFICNNALSVRRFYADEKKVPQNYMIVNANNYHIEEKDFQQVIPLNSHRIAVPMKMYFRDNDMSLYEQWQIIRIARSDLHQNLRSKPELLSAFRWVCNREKEENFKDLFYDLQKENPVEFAARLKKVKDDKTKTQKKIEDIETTIQKLRKTRNGEWNVKYDDFYKRYERSKQYMKISFRVYCKTYNFSDNDPWSIYGAMCKKYSVSWKIAQLNEQLIAYKQKLQDIIKIDTSEVYKYTFEVM